MSAPATLSSSITPVTLSAWTQLMGDDLLYVDPTSSDPSRVVSDVQI